MLINNDSTSLFFGKNFVGGSIINDELNLQETADKVKKLHSNAEQLLIEWLDNPPEERRQIQAFNLLVNAVQMLNAACINLGVIEMVDEE